MTEIILESYHKNFDKSRTFKEKYLGSKKYIGKLILIVLFLIDFGIFYGYYPEAVVRFSRPVRPCKYSNRWDINVWLLPCLILSSVSGAIFKIAEKNCAWYIAIYEIDGWYYFILLAHHSYLRNARCEANWRSWWRSRIR